VATPNIECINSQDVPSPQATDPAAPSRYPTRVRTAPTTWYDTFVGVSLSDERR
jgi:hypothetical protein